MAEAGNPDQPDAFTNFNSGGIGQVLLGLGATLEFFMLAATAARLYTKQRILRRWTPDDYTCIVAAIATTAYFIVGCYVVTKAASDSIAAGEATTDFLIANWITQWLSPLSFVFVKLSFFLLYLQIFRPIRALRIAALVGAIYCTLLWGFLFFFRLGAVTPRPGQSWDVVGSSWGLYTNRVLVVISGPFDIISNLHILILPMVGISKLELSGKKKAAIIAVIMTGLLALIASLVSMYYRVGFLAESRTQSAYYSNTVCVIVELQIGIFCCNMPAVSALLRHHFTALDFATTHPEMRASHPYNSRHTYTDLTGKNSAHSRAMASHPGPIGNGASDDFWEIPPLPSRVHPAMREVGVPTPPSIEMDEISLDSNGRPRQPRQLSRPASLLMGLLPSSGRSTPRPSRASSTKRSVSPWAIRGLLDGRDPNASLGDRILVQTNIHVKEEGNKATV